MQPIRQAPPPPPPTPRALLPVRGPALPGIQPTSSYRGDWATQPAGPQPIAGRPTPPPEAQEGIGSFFTGAVAGNFSDNHTWSATAGQVAMGFVPIAGQIADVRDTAASIGQIARGESGGWLNLGASLIGFVPGIGDAAKAALRGGGNAAQAGADAARTAARTADDAVAPGAARKLAEPPALQPAPRADTPPPPSGPASGLANAADEGPTLMERAELAGDVYKTGAKDSPISPPAGFRVASADEIRALGVDANLLGKADEKGFFARVYAHDSPAGTSYTVAFRGTNPSSMKDIAADAKQAFGADSVHYARALEIGRQLQNSGAEVTLVGHSLGGGLAAEAAIASGRDATTFNAAGLHGSTIAKAEDAAGGRAAGDVDNYRVDGEALTMLQENPGARGVVGALAGGATGAGIGSIIPGLGTIVGGIGGAIGGGVGAAKLDLPKAFGDQHTMPYVKPEGASWWQNNPVNRHMIDAVLASTARYTGG